MAPKVHRCTYRYQYGENKGKICNLPAESGDYCKWYTGIDPDDIPELLDKKSDKKAKK